MRAHGGNSDESAHDTRRSAARGACRRFEPASQTDRERTLRWRDAASHPANVAALRDTIAADWRVVVAACVGAKLLTAEVAKGLEPDIVLDDWNLLDVRKDTSVPLPDRTVPPRRR